MQTIRGNKVIPSITLRAGLSISSSGIHNCARTQRGFSLVELLATVAIIAVLAALILPAIQFTRESSRKATCQNNLKQLSLAALLYQSSHSSFPPGLLAPVPARSVFSGGRVSERDHQMIGTLPFLLSFIEENAVAETIGSDMLNINSEPSFQIWLQNVDTWQAAHSTIVSFHCPSSDRIPPEKGVLVFNNPYFDHALDKPLLQGAPLNIRLSFGLGTTDYLGNAGHFSVINDPDIDPFRGPFFNRSHTKPSQISDGNSNTLFFGEVSGAVVDGRRLYAHSWMGSGPMPMAFGIGNLEKWNNFSSHHPGFVGFSTIDGAVHYLRVDTSQEILESLAGIAEGDPTAINEL